MRTRVILNAPFMTGLSLNVRDAALEKYQSVRTALDNTREALPYGLWRLANQEHSTGLQIDVDTRRGTTLVPHFLVERHLALDGADEARVDLPAELTDSQVDALLAIREVRIRICDFGVGSLVVDCDLIHSNGKDLREIRAAVETLSSKARLLEPIVRETILAAHQLVPSALVTTWDGAAFTKLLWVHRVFMFSTDQFQRLAVSDIETIVFRHAQEPVRNVSISEGLEFYVGEGNSLCVYSREADMSQALLLYRVIQAQNIYFTKLLAMDRELFDALNQLSKDVHVKSISGIQKIGVLETKSHEMVNRLEAASTFEAVYRDYAFALDPQSTLIWEAVCESWGTETRFESVTRKLETLEKIYDRTRNSLRSLYDSQLNWLVLAFTFAGFFSVFVDVVNFIQEEGLRGPSYLRLGILTSMAVIIGLLILMLIRRRTPI